MHTECLSCWLWYGISEYLVESCSVEVQLANADESVVAALLSFPF